MLEELENRPNRHCVIEDEGTKQGRFRNKHPGYIKHHLTIKDDVTIQGHHVPQGSVKDHYSKQKKVKHACKPQNFYGLSKLKNESINLRSLDKLFLRMLEVKELKN